MFFREVGLSCGFFGVYIGFWVMFFGAGYGRTVFFYCKEVKKCDLFLFVVVRVYSSEIS